MVHIRFWFMMMMLLYWVEAYILQRKNTDDLVFASKETGLELDADKTKYMVVSQIRMQDEVRL